MHKLILHDFNSYGKIKTSNQSIIQKTKCIICWPRVFNLGKRFWTFERFSFQHTKTSHCQVLPMFISGQKMGKIVYKNNSVIDYIHPSWKMIKCLKNHPLYQNSYPTILFRLTNIWHFFSKNVSLIECHVVIEWMIMMTCSKLFLRTNRHSHAVENKKLHKSCYITTKFTSY